MRENNTNSDDGQVTFSRGSEESAFTEYHTSALRLLSGWEIRSDDSGNLQFILVENGDERVVKTLTKSGDWL